MMLRETIGKAVAALLRWLGLALGLVRPSWEAAATALLLLWRRLLRRASPPGDTAPWSELPPELLGLVFSRLPSQADRVRLRAVCRPWRSAARLQPLAPQLPCLVLRGNTLLTLPNGTLHRLPVDWEDIDFRRSTGGMLFLEDRFSRCYLMNPFSRETTPERINPYEHHSGRHCDSYHWIRKVVVSHHIVAVLGSRGTVHFFPRGESSCSTMVWAPPVNTHVAVDIALFQGKFYVLAAKHIDGDSELPELHLLDIRFLGISGHKQTRLRSVQCIQGMPRNNVDPGLPANQRRCFFFYLAVSGDRLLMVERQTDVEVPFTFNLGSSRPIRTQFEVSELVYLIGCHGRWSKVDTLMGHTLFVSQDCSRSLPAQCGAREDCIYFVTKWMLNPQDDILDCIVYNVKDKTMEPLTPEMRAAMAMQVRNRGRWRPTWLFPVDV